MVDEIDGELAEGTQTRMSDHTRFMAHRVDCKQELSAITVNVGVIDLYRAGMCPMDDQ